MEDFYVSKSTTYVRFFFYLWTAMQRPGQIIHISRRSLFQFNNERTGSTNVYPSISKHLRDIRKWTKYTKNFLYLALSSFSRIRSLSYAVITVSAKAFIGIDQTAERAATIFAAMVFDMILLHSVERKKIIPWRGSSSRRFDIPRIIRLELLSSVRHYLLHLEYPARYPIFSSVGFQDNPAQPQKRTGKIEKCVDETRKNTDGVTFNAGFK